MSYILREDTRNILIIELNNTIQYLYLIILILNFKEQFLPFSKAFK